MDKRSAIRIKRLSNVAISALSELLLVVQKSCPSTQYENTRKAVGRAIANIQYDLLDELVNRQYPDLDDLK